MHAFLSVACHSVKSTKRKQWPKLNKEVHPDLEPKPYLNPHTLITLNPTSTSFRTLVHSGNKTLIGPCREQRVRGRGGFELLANRGSGLIGLILYIIHIVWAEFDRLLTLEERRGILRLSILNRYLGPSPASADGGAGAIPNRPDSILCCFQLRRWRRRYPLDPLVTSREVFDEKKNEVAELYHSPSRNISGSAGLRQLGGKPRDASPPPVGLSENRQVELKKTKGNKKLLNRVKWVTCCSAPRVLLPDRISVVSGTRPEARALVL